jgi:uncharacterized membrane protein YkvA (DUF1232 family)
MDYDDILNKYAKNKKVHPEDKNFFFEKLMSFFNLLDVSALWHIATHPDCAAQVFDWLDITIIIAVVAYVIMPLDAIPDFIPGLGLLDDAAIVTYVLSKYGSLIQRYKEICMEG